MNGAWRRSGVQAFRRWGIAIAALLALTAGHGSAALPPSHSVPERPNAQTPERPNAHTFVRPPVMKAVEPNGLRLLAVSNPSSDIVAIDCLVRAGLRDEKEEQAGIAALVGEAAIRGTERHSPAKMAAAVGAVGGSLEVTPGFDFTEFSLTTTRDRFPPALSLLAEVLGSASMQPEAIDAAKTALKSRIAAQGDDLMAGSYRELLVQLYPTAPYGRPIMGIPASLDQIGRKDLEAFYHQYYVQNNMVIAISGNIDTRSATELARKAFAPIPFRPQSPTPSHPAPPPVPGARPHITMRRQRAPAAQVMLGALAPPTTAQTYPTWMVLDAIMGGGKRARLFIGLREKHGVGYELGSFYQPLLDNSHLVAYVVTDAYRTDPKTQVPEMALDAVRTDIVAQFQSLADHGPTDAELQRAKNFAIGSFARQHERNRDQAHWLVWMEAMGMGYGFDRELPAKIATVTKEQIQQASKDCLNHYALVVTVPTAEPGSDAP